MRAAHVIDVIVGDDEVIDRLHAGGAGGVDDPAGIALAGISGVDQHRLAGGRDDERGGAALGVDEVEAEIGVGRQDWRGEQGREHQRGREAK